MSLKQTPSNNIAIEVPIELPIAFGLPIWIAYLIALGGQGSWAGPAWLGRPRVLGRTGLAWGAKGPGPGRLGSSLF